MSGQRERGILFSAPLIPKLLSGEKTQTRRVVKTAPYARADKASLCLDNTVEDGALVWHFTEQGMVHNPHVRCPYGEPGDLLWVRETWFVDPPDDGTWAYLQWAGCKEARFKDIPERFYSPEHCLYRADWKGPDLSWLPSIHMPKWAARIWLEITGVRVERLQDISEDDAKAEGVEASKLVTMKDGSPCYTSEFQRLWTSINGIDNPASWYANPWVWVLSFKRLDARSASPAQAKGAG